ncbi:MAG: hypothetical protein WBX22_14225 [Silvibacterium sp.]
MPDLITNVTYCCNRFWQRRPDGWLALGWIRCGAKDHLRLGGRLHVPSGTNVRNTLAAIALYSGGAGNTLALEVPLSANSPEITRGYATRKNGSTYAAHVLERLRTQAQVRPKNCQAAFLMDRKPWQPQAAPIGSLS